MDDSGAPADAAAPAPQRRFATIVAIDAAGYSRQSEIDEATAVREIAALAERIRASAASRNGRVFNTAGDGFMLEFPSVSAAVAAAEEVQAVDRVPLRIGIHVGEVHETATGDLLGKGVNIAARLMQATQPGSILISGDAKRALPADVTARLQRRGTERLDKMSERIETYALGSPWKRPKTISLRWALIGAGALIALVAAIFAGQMLLRPNSQAIAVLEFDALDSSLQPFTAGLADRLIGAMSSNDLLPAHASAGAGEDRIAAAARAGAAFVLAGSARTAGDDLLVNARLIDTRGNVAIWSKEYTRTAIERNYMQEQIAFDVARILHCALVSLEPQAGVDAATLAVFMRACQSRGGGDLTAEEGYQAARQVTERAPRFSRGWSMRGLIAAEMTTWNLPPDETNAYVAEARDAAERARRLDPGNGEAFLIEATLLPSRDWRGRQALIDRALEVEPDLAAAHVAQAWVYVEVGRARAALRAMDRAIAIEPLNGDYQASRTPFLNAAGEHAAAQANNDRLYRIWPNSQEAWWNRLMNSSYVGDPAEALRLLDEAENSAAAPPIAPAVRARWRAFVAARQSGDAAAMRRAALALREIPRGQFSRGSIGAALSLAGEVDASFEIAESMLSGGYPPGALFLPPWRNLRRDPRYMRLIRDTGLIEHWREAGQWPDFCSEPDLPYDCQEEAARVLPL